MMRFRSRQAMQCSRAARDARLDRRDPRHSNAVRHELSLTYQPSPTPCLAPACSLTRSSPLFSMVRTPLYLTAAFPRLVAKKRTERVVVKLINEEEDWAVSARLVDKDGKPVAGLKATTKRG